MTSDFDYMNELERAHHLKPSRASLILLFTIAALVAFFLLWSSLARVDELVRGQGEVVPTADIQFIQSLEGGILAELLVTEGDKVEEGDVLVRISDVMFSSEERGTEARLARLEAKKARLLAESKGETLTLPDQIVQAFPDIAENERALYASRQKELENALSILDDKISGADADMSEVQANISRLSNSRALVQKELNLTREMAAKKAVPQLEVIRLEREVSDLSGQIRASSEKKSGIEAELRSAQKEKGDQQDRFRSQVLGELNDVQTELTGLQESLKSIGDRVDRAELRAPVSGVVNAVAVKTIGGVIEPAQRLIEIVPLDSDLKIIAQVSPNDIAFLKVGQEANVKITAYDPQRYGHLTGKLTRVAATSTKDREGHSSFEIEVITDKNYLGSEENPLPISPGMVAQTEILTGKRTILEYLVRPALRLKDRAFRER